MSTFGGHMKEYQNISIDRYDKENLLSTVYCLSHCHQDHMVGLDSDNMTRRLQYNSDIKLYVSEVTKALMSTMPKWEHLTDYMVALPVEEPTSISVANHYGHPYTVLLTLLSAGHCPGSVMFLFEGGEGIVLYTGDFRLNKGFAARMTALHTCGSVKRIKSLYIDTTFCAPNAIHIPSREECAQAVVLAIKEWISKGEQYCIHLIGKASIGYEDVYRAVNEAFNTKVHVLPSKYHTYSKVQDITSLVTENQEETQIHACWRPKCPNGRLACDLTHRGGKPVKVRSIVMSTMWFTEQVAHEKCTVRSKMNPETNMRACYSFHSSYSEVRDFVTYLKPQKVYPNVVPRNETMDVIQERLNKFLSVPHAIHMTSPTVYRPLGIIHNSKWRKSIGMSSESQSLDFGEESLSPRPKYLKNMSQGIQNNINSTPPKMTSSMYGQAIPGSPYTPNKSFVSPAKSDVSDSQHNQSSGSELNLYSSDDETMNHTTPKKVDCNNVQQQQHYDTYESLPFCNYKELDSQNSRKSDASVKLLLAKLKSSFDVSPECCYLSDDDDTNDSVEDNDGLNYAKEQFDGDSQTLASDPPELLTSNEDDGIVNHSVEICGNIENHHNVRKEKVTEFDDDSQTLANDPPELLTTKNEEDGVNHSIEMCDNIKHKFREEKVTQLEKNSDVFTTEQCFPSHTQNCVVMHDDFDDCHHSNKNVVKKEKITVGEVKDNISADDENASISIVDLTESDSDVETDSDETIDFEQDFQHISSQGKNETEDSIVSIPSNDCILVTNDDTDDDNSHNCIVLEDNDVIVGDISNCDTEGKTDLERLNFEKKFDTENTEGMNNSTIKTNHSENDIVEAWSYDDALSPDLFI